MSVARVRAIGLGAAKLARAASSAARLWVLLACACIGTPPDGPRPPGQGPACGAGEVACGSHCIDPTRDTWNCGGCGRMCAYTEACVLGACGCAGGSTRCGTVCIDLRASRHDCGACGNACLYAEECTNGRCLCEGLMVRCGGGCVDTRSSAAHCGACDRACAPTEACVGGRCVARCPTGRATCELTASGTCETDLATSTRHCGMCHRACRAGEVCREGRCRCEPGAPCLQPTAPLVPQGTPLCGALSPITECPPVSGAEAECVAGHCVYRCIDLWARCAPGDTSPCGRPLNTREACGACGVACAATQRCAWGVCACAPGQTVCGAACIDLQTHAAHCGACGAACRAGQDCVAGRCAARPGPRPLAPPSGAVVANRRPTFRWLPSGDEASAQVELCADRACARPLRTLRGAGGVATPAEALAPGVVFWRVRSLRVDGSTPPGSATWEFQVGSRAGEGGSVIGHFIDINGDGFTDHVTIQSSLDQPCVYFGSATGLQRGTCPVWTSADGAPVRTGVFTLGDMDGDGFTDLAAAVDAGGLSLFRGGPSGLAPAEAWWLTTDHWRDMGGAKCVGDVDGDGYADMLSAGLSGGEAVTTIVRGGPSGARLWPSQFLLPAPGFWEGAAWGAAVVGDANGDGRLELVTQPLYGTERVTAWVYSAGSDGVIGSPAATLVGGRRSTAQQRTLSGDFDGDGLVDVALVDGSVLHVFRGTPGGISTTPAQSLTASVSTPWVTDFEGGCDLNGDGRSDLVSGGGGGEGLRLDVRYGTAAGLSATTVRTSALDPAIREGRVLRLGDVNRDGYDDVALVASGSYFVYLGGPTGLPDYPSQRFPVAVQAR